MNKCIDDKMDVGMNIERLLERFCRDFSSKLGGKLGPSWQQNPKNEVAKTISKKHQKSRGPNRPGRLQAGPGRG